MAYNLGNKCAKNWTIDNSTLCLKKTCDHIFDDTLNYVYKDFWHTYYQEYRPSTGILVSHLTYLVQLLYLGKLSRLKYL